ncbi:unnamed protein product [Pleuronectes platessa]|uniref:Uncharacterized protein n=1 Tax=Pleuronectes platessa TaxID=8262 RepID=A0A9N7VN66_PLEPL|nr:unnamed protein product [Pleuronectes platessa]
MCYSTDSPLARPDNHKPSHIRDMFSSPRGRSQCVSVMGSLLLHPGSLLPPPRCFPTHRAPPGSGHWPRRQDLNTPHAFLLAQPREPSMDRARGSCPRRRLRQHHRWIESDDPCESGDMDTWRLKGGKQITQRQSYSELQPSLLSPAPLSAFGPITLAGR